MLGFDNLLINLLYSIWNKDQGWQYRNFEKDRDVENTLFKSYSFQSVATNTFCETSNKKKLENVRN